MDSQLENSVFYFSKRLEETEGKPELHRNLRLLYQKYLDLIEEYPEQLSRFTSNVFPIIKAEKCDKHRAYVELFRRLGHAEAQQIHERFLSSIKSASSLQEMKKISLSESFLKTDETDNRRRELFTLCSQLTDYLKSDTEEKEGLKKSIKATWARFAYLDPEISWRKICEHKPYRYSLYYDDERLRILGATLREALK